MKKIHYQEMYENVEEGVELLNLPGGVCKIRIQAPPGNKFLIDDVSITIGYSGFYEIGYDQMYVQSIMYDGFNEDLFPHASDYIGGTTLVDSFDLTEVNDDNTTTTVTYNFYQLQGPIYIDTWMREEE